MEEHKNVTMESGAVAANAPVTVAEIAEGMTSEAKARILARYDMKSFAKIFEDGEISETCLAFFRCGLNVSRTARRLYMHRNTLIYRLDKVRVLTGLDLREMDAAVTFELLYRLYSEKRSNQR